MSEKKKWDISHFEIGRKLGSGQFGNVYVVKEKSSNFVLALKMIKKNYIQQNDLHNQLKREIEIHSHLLHPNILRLYGYFHDVNRVYIMVELATKGELYMDIQKYHGFNDQRVATYLFQLTQALMYCHSRNVMHRDIKPENILMASKGQIKLADFGWSVHNKAGHRKTMCGTLDYLAPEMIKNDCYTEKIDIWCTGVLMFEMLTTTVPFHHPSDEATRTLITQGQFEVPPNVNVHAKDLLTKILRLEPKARLSLEEIQRHKYLTLFSENVTDECKAAMQMWRLPAPTSVPSSSEEDVESSDGGTE